MGGINHIIDINTWCCNRNSTKCEEACDEAQCKYGCSFWKDNPIIPARCGENFGFTYIFTYP